MITTHSGLAVTIRVLVSSVLVGAFGACPARKPPADPTLDEIARRESVIKSVLEAPLSRFREVCILNHAAETVLDQCSLEMRRSEAALLWCSRLMRVGEATTRDTIGDLGKAVVRCVERLAPQETLPPVTRDAGDDGREFVVPEEVTSERCHQARRRTVAAWEEAARCERDEECSLLLRALPGVGCTVAVSSRRSKLVRDLQNAFSEFRAAVDEEHCYTSRGEACLETFVDTACIGGYCDLVLLRSDPAAVRAIWAARKQGAQLQ